SGERTYQGHPVWKRRILRYISLIKTVNWCILAVTVKASGRYGQKKILLSYYASSRLSCLPFF
ncbi:MAG TPA: hypothetical protein VI385_08725, partial [Flavisolibacter sp.]